MTIVVDKSKWSLNMVKDMENHILKEIITEIKIESVQLRHQLESSVLTEGKMVDKVMRILEICNKI